MPYTPNVSDATEPILSRPVSSAAEEFRNVKESLGGILTQSVRAPVGEVLSELPATAVRAGKWLQFDSAGNPSPVAADPADVASLAAARHVIQVTATEGQTDFALGGEPQSISFVAVAVDGMPLTEADYFLLDASTLRLTVALYVGQEVTIRWDDSIPLTSVASTGVSMSYPNGLLINVQKWIDGSRVVTGAPTDAIFSNIADAFTEANARNKAILLGGMWTAASKITLFNDIDIEGLSRDTCGLILAASVNDHLLYGTGISSISLRKLTLNGNKANQTSGAVARALYLLDVARVKLSGLYVHSAADHAAFVSVGPTTDPLSDSSLVWVDGCIFATSGTDVLSGNGGSGFAANCSKLWATNSYSIGNLLGGFKFTGEEVYATNLHAEGNLGGGFTTGFDVVTFEGKYHKYVACHAIGNGNLASPADGGDGFRHQGQVDRIEQWGCVARNNTWAGTALIASTVVKPTEVAIYGGDYRNNGQSFTASDIVSGAGVFSGSTASAPNVPSVIRIMGATLTDDQTVKTQSYGLEAKKGDQIYIGDGTKLAGNKTQSISIATTQVTDLHLSPAIIDADFIARSNTAASVTGTLTETDLQSIVIPASTMCLKQRYRIRARGTVAGTAGTKVVRLYWGSANGLLISEAAADVQEWVIDGIIEINSAGANKCAATGIEYGGTTTNLMIQNATNINSAITCKVTGTLGNVADTITCSSFYFEPIY